MSIDQCIEALARSLQLLASLPAIAKKPALSAPPKPTRKWHDSRPTNRDSTAWKAGKEHRGAECPPGTYLDGITAATAAFDADPALLRQLKPTPGTWISRVPSSL